MLKNEYTIDINNETYKVEMKYSLRRRTVSARYLGGVFYVNSPSRISEKRLLEVLNVLLPDFIRRNKKKGDEAFKEEDIDENGIYIFGEYQPFSDGFIKVFGKYFLFFDKEDFYKKVKKNFLLYLTERSEMYRKMMNIDANYSYNVVWKKATFGVNYHKKKRIVYNAMLIHYSPEIIDSVIVHELAHEYEQNHSKNFYNVVYKYYPNYKEVDKKLKKGQHKWSKKLKAKTINL